MKFEYDYHLQSLAPNGDAIVEYSHPSLGSRTVHMVLPLSQGLTAMKQKIAEKFPVEWFYSNWLMTQQIALPDQLVTGKITIDFEDFFYTVTDEKTRT